MRKPKAKRVNGDMVAMIVSMIMAKNNLPYEPKYFPYVMERLPDGMKGNADVELFVRTLLNG